MCFSSKAPKAIPPIPPQAPVEEAAFKPGGDQDEDRKKLKKTAEGKKRLQIPLSAAPVASGVQTGYNP